MHDITTSSVRTTYFSFPCSIFLTTKQHMLEWYRDTLVTGIELHVTCRLWSFKRHLGDKQTHSMNPKKECYVVHTTLELHGIAFWNVATLSDCSWA